MSQLDTIKLLLKEAVSDCVKKHDLDTRFDTIQLSFETQLDNFKKAADELTERIKAIQSENFVTRDQVLDILKEVKSDTEHESNYPQIRDVSTEWEVVKETKAQGKVERDYVFRMDSRFAPRTRYVRAIDENESVPGAGTGIGTPINELRAGNPFASYIGTVTVGTNGTFQLIDMTQMNFVEEGTHTPGRTKQGGSSARPQVVKNYTLESVVSDAALEDVAAYRMGVEEAIMMADSNNKGAQIFSELKTSAVAVGANTIKTMKTGVATGLPTVANMLDIIADLEGMLPTAYRAGAVWHMSRTALTTLRKTSSSNGLNFDSERRINMLNGYPVVPNDHCEDGSTANDISVIFGNFRRGCGMGMRVALDVRIYEQTSPGAVTFFARSRFRPAVNDFRGLVALRSAA